MLRQAAQADPVEHVDSQQLVESARERTGRIDLVVAERTHHEYRHPGDRPSDVIQQRQRSFIGPVQILEQQEHRARCGGPAQKFDDRVEKDPSRLLRRNLQRRRNVREEAAKLRHQARHFRRVVAERGPKSFLARRLRHRGFKNFDERVERERIFAIVATADQRDESTFRSFGCELGGDSGLAHAQRAANHRYSALSVQRSLEQAAQRGAFRFSADKRRAIGQRLHETVFGPGENRGRYFRDGGLVAPKRELPRDRVLRTRKIRAESSGPDRSIEQIAQLSVMLGYFLQRGFDRASNVEARPLSSGTRAPDAPAKTYRARHLAQQKIQLGLCAGDALLIATLAPVFQFLAQSDDLALVLVPGLRIEHLARIAETDSDSCACEQRGLARVFQFDRIARARAIEEIQRMKFLTGMLQHALDVAESLDVSQREARVGVSYGPKLAVADEHPLKRDSNFRRLRMAFALG